MQCHPCQTTYGFMDAVSNSNFPYDIKVQYTLLYQALKQDSLETVEKELSSYAFGLKWNDLSFLHEALERKCYNLATECIKKGACIKSVIKKDLLLLFRLMEYLACIDEKDVIDKILFILSQEFTNNVHPEMQLFLISGFLNVWNTNPICKTLPIVIRNKTLTLFN